MASLLETLESRMLETCLAPDTLNHPCHLAAQAHFTAGGARIRANICLEAGHRLQLAPEDSLQLAIVCELLHNASLIQDDLLDRTRIRRGRPSIWLEFGETMALCLSDLMLAGAYASLGKLTHTSAIPAAMALVHQRTRDVVLGQALENVTDHTFLSALALYERRARGKSASLLSLPLELPLLISGNAGAMKDAHEAANCFAVAYQISDDLEDLEQDEAQGSLNIVLMLERRQGLLRAQAQSSAAGYALRFLHQSEVYAARLPFQCAAVMDTSAKRLTARLAAFEHSPLALAGD
jgi:geranylgeranyl diphosphate synthase type II